MIEAKGMQLIADCAHKPPQPVDPIDRDVPISEPSSSLIVSSTAQLSRSQEHRVALKTPVDDVKAFR